MAYDIGFVDRTGSEGIAHWQLLRVIQTLAEANGWTTLRYLTPNDPAQKRELILQGAGLSGTAQIFIGLRAYQDPSADYYNVSVAGFTGYVPENAFDAQPGYFESGIPAHNQRIDYWLTINAQRIAFGLKVGTPVYECGYVGLCLPYATPGQFPYPLVVGGMLAGIPATRFSETTHSVYAKGTRANFGLRFVDGSWRTLDAWPWINGTIAGGYQLRDTGDHYPLLPLRMTMNGLGELGELDGIAYVSGFNNTVETLIQVGGTPVVDDPTWTAAQRAAAIVAAGGTPHVVLQDVGRNGFTDYLAMRLD